MKARWLFDLAVTSLGLVALAACAVGSSQIGSGSGGDGGDDWTGSSSSSSSSSGNGGAGGGGGSSGGAGGGASSSSASSASSSSGGGCGETPCKLVAPQCGCAAGEACTIDDMGARLCDTAGTVQIGSECTTPTDCAAGGLCLLMSSTKAACYEFCSSDAQCTAPGGLCVVTLTSSSGNPIPNVTLCSTDCNPATNAGCSIAGTACRFGREPAGQKRLFTLCGEAGTGTAGSSCSSNDDCAGGYGCFGTTCEKFCVMGGAACPGAGTCSPFTLGQDMVEPIIGSTTYGACL